MSAKSKGRYTITLCKEYYESKGYLVDEVELGGRFRKSKDLFSGLCFECGSVCSQEGHETFPGFDLVAIKPSEPILLIQVKTNIPATQQPYKDFAKIYASRHVYVVVWTHYRRQGPRIQRYCKNGSIQEIDLR